MVSPSPRLIAFASRLTLRGDLSLRMVAALTLAASGCSNSAPEPKPADAAYMASGGRPGTDESVTGNEALRRLANSTAAVEESLNANPSSAAPRGQAISDGRPVSADTPASGGNDVTVDQDQRSQQDVDTSRLSPAGSVRDLGIGRSSLPPDLSPQQLVRFLGVTDRDMQDIWSRISQVQGGRDELIRIAKMKLEASRRLKEHPDAAALEKSAGARGELQALSHLAAFSDLKSAEELELLATANLQSADADVVADSRLVLIGFALESLQNGAPGSADRIIGYIDQITAAGRANDVPTLMVMGQARDALAGYGHEDHANRVRDAIIELYADSPNPDLAMAAAELVGGILFDEVDRLVVETLNGQVPTAAAWRAAVDELLDKAPNRRTVEYLAGSSLQLEATGNDELVQITFDAMANRFGDPSSELGREVRIAVAARDARQGIVGIGFNPVLPSLDGSPLTMETYLGRVVLVPFWAAAFPESLQLVGRLKEIQSAHPDDIAIVGVNLDGNDAELQEFVEQIDLGFPSFRSKSSAEAEVANPLAAKFGIASMPFLAIVDRQGRVAAVDFVGREVQAKIEALLAK